MRYDRKYTIASYGRNRTGGERKMPAELESMAAHIREYTESLSCVYFLTERDKVVYVGQTIDLGSRLRTHVHEKSFDRVFYLPVAEKHLDAVEGAFVRAINPSLNTRPGPSVVLPGKILKDFGFVKKGLNWPTTIEELVNGI